MGTEEERRRDAMAAMFAELARLLPAAGQSLPPQKRRQYLAVVERALDYLYCDEHAVPEVTPDGR